MSPRVTAGNILENQKPACLNLVSVAKKNGRKQSFQRATYLEQKKGGDTGHQ